MRVPSAPGAAAEPSLGATVRHRLSEDMRQRGEAVRERVLRYDPERAHWRTTATGCAFTGPLPTHTH